MKLEPKHVISYLPYELECRDLVEETDFQLDVLNIDGVLNDAIHFDTIRLYLRPLSMLTEFCEDLGFVPLDELNNCEFIKYYLFNNGNTDFLLADIKEGYNVLEQSSAKEKLLEWHFDIFNLIPNNLAIDKTTVS
jgi:hypothetical protein